ncbi:MAG: primosomal replication protein, partial [Gammaproteobacteria bacterium]|nr:primosomal replication protein [Gammaproteobacteria bacterium]
MPATLRSDWFSAELFQCRSDKSCDYLQEIRDNLQKLSQLSEHSTSYQWFVEHVDAQLNAFIQAVYRAKRPAKASSVDRHAQKTSRATQLQLELAKHHEYERRLTDNLREAQMAADTEGKSERVIACQQRLLRCQRAIAALEKRIAM